MDVADRFREIRERLLELAQTDTDIAAIIEIGSQTRADQPADQFSDQDVILAAQEPSRYLYTEELISRLGNPLISFTEPTLAGATERRGALRGLAGCGHSGRHPRAAKGSGGIRRTRGNLGPGQTGAL